MRKIFSMFAALLFAGSMMAADVVKATLDFTDNTAWKLPVGSGAGITTDSAYSDGTYTIRLAATTKYYFHADGYLLFGKSGSTLTLPAFDFDVTKIVVTGRAGASGSTKQNIFVGENAVSTETTGAAAANEYAIASDYQAAGNVYVLKVTSAHNTQVTKIEIYGEGETPAVATPVISGEAEFTESTQVSISCETASAAIFYTLDGADPTSNSLPYGDPFTLTESATVKAVAYDIENNAYSAVASKTFTKKEPLAAISCAAVYELAKGAELALNDVVVTYANGKYVYVQDTTGAMLLYLAGNTTWKAGDVLAGVEGALDIYNGLYEVKLTNDQATAVQATAGEAPAAIELTAAPKAADMNKYIVLKGVTMDTTAFVNKNINATIGDETFVIRNQFGSNMVFDTTAVYDITGVVALYNTTVQVYLTSAVLVSNPEMDAMVFNWSVLSGAQIGTINYGASTEASTVKVHTNTFTLDAIKFNSSYVYADGKYITIKPKEGSFKAGDELSVMVWFSNADDSTKYAMVDVYAADGTTRLFRSDSAKTVNGRLHEEDAEVQTFKLAADQDSLLLGRYGNTTMYINYLRVIREVMDTIPTTAPEAPKQAEEDVMAIYCNHYTTNNANFNISGWAGAYQTLNIDGTQVGFMKDMTWECIIDPVKTDSAHDFSAYENLHIDMWAPQAAKIKFAAEAVAGGNYKDGVVLELKKGWNCFDIALADWTGAYEFKNLKCFVLEQYQTPAGESFEHNPFAFANLYFWNNPAPVQYEVAEAIAAGLKDDDEVLVRGIITKMEFKGKNFAKYGSVNIYVADATGAQGEFEFYNCYSLEADTFRISTPAYDPASTAWAQFSEVVDGNGVAIHVGDTVIARGKYKLFNSTHELNTGCYLVDIKHAPIAPVADTVEVSLSEGLRYDDYVAAKGWWQIYGGDDKYVVSISNISTTQAEGTYTVADLDADYTYLGVIEGKDTTFVAFVDGSVTLSTNAEAGSVTVEGTLIGNDNKAYHLNLLYVAPQAKDTVVLNIPEAALIDYYAAYGLYGVYGTNVEKDHQVYIALWAEDGFQGEFTEADIDMQYIGTGVIDIEGVHEVYTASITVTPGNGGDYNITADLLCYNNTLYKVTMYVPAAQAIDEVDAAQKAVKMIKGGQLIIEKAGKSYNVLGTRL